MTPRSISDPTTTGTELGTPELEDQIRRAYELYEQRGRDEGHDIDDWLQAKAELTQQAKAKAA